MKLFRQVFSLNSSNIKPGFPCLSRVAPVPGWVHHRAPAPGRHCLRRWPWGLEIGIITDCSVGCFYLESIYVSSVETYQMDMPKRKKRCDRSKTPRPETEGFLSIRKAAVFANCWSHAIGLQLYYPVYCLPLNFQNIINFGDNPADRRNMIIWLSSLHVAISLRL